jgi:hypothetical protein
MKCIRVHRARRTLQCAAAVIALAAAGRSAAAQQGYPPGYPVVPQYPVYPATPSQPVVPPYPGYPMGTVPPTPGAAPTLAAYRAPIITLAQPAEGVVLPADKPVAVLRFLALEPLDPIDALSLSVTVDGTDRTSLFTLTQGEAWGRLSPPDEVLSAGQHEIRARICSTRGTCGTAKATVTVVSSASLLERLGTSVSTTQASQSGPSRTSKIFGAVLQAVRVLIR